MFRASGEGVEPDVGVDVGLGEGDVEGEGAVNCQTATEATIIIIMVIIAARYFLLHVKFHLVFSLYIKAYC